MKILDDLVMTLRQGEVVRDVRQGLFQTAVLTQYCGLASTLRDKNHHHYQQQANAPVKDAGTLIGREALKIAQMAYSSSLLEAAIGMATVNSLLEINEERCVDLNARELLVEKGKGKKVVLVGHFPFVSLLHKAAARLWVLEQRPREGDFAAEEAEKFIPQADVVGITGTAFTNHTIEHLLGLCRPEAYVVLLGGTAPLSPVLFDYGVDAISGTKVVDAEAVLRCVSQGATFRQIEGIRLLTMKR